MRFFAAIAASVALLAATDVPASEYQARRAAVAKAIGADSVFIALSAQPARRTGDIVMECTGLFAERGGRRLFDGVDLKQYGRADFEQMLANVADLPPEQRKSLMVNALNELVYVIQLAVRTQLGVQEEAVVSGVIKDGLRRLGSG